MTRDTAPPRGFPLAEFEARTTRAQALMAAREIDALLLTTEPEVRYFSGFRSQFWESPTRPWFLVVPRAGRPIAVIPEIGAAGMAETWIEDIRTWPAPQPEDDGISLLAATDAGIAAARPSATHEDLWAVMWKVLEAGGALGETVGRLGHGLGMQLTEGPSNKPGDRTVLVPGMVITIEPGMVFSPGKLMVHEENIAITDGPAELLSRRAPPEMPVIR